LVNNKFLRVIFSIDFQPINTTLYCTYYEYSQVMPAMKTCLLSLFVCLSLLLPQAKVFSADLLIVDSLTAEPYTSVRLAMMQELQTQGFSQNSNLTVKRWSVGNADGMSKRVWLEERGNNYDVIFLNGTIATLNFKKFAYNNSSYKFVFAAVTDPVDIGVIENFTDQPKSNFTGVSFPVAIEDRLRFIKTIMPSATHIGFIYAEMPPSLSYIKRLKKVLKRDEFKDLTFYFRSVDFVRSEAGDARMAQLAKKHIRELDPHVNLFLSPNDTMGSQKAFAKVVYEEATKPLVGLGRADVMGDWGAAVSIYPSYQDAGRKAGVMIADIFRGKNLKDIIPQQPEYGIALDLEKAKEFGISIPEGIIKKAGEDIIKKN